MGTEIGGLFILDTVEYSGRRLANRRLSSIKKQDGPLSDALGPALRMVSIPVIFGSTLPFSKLGGFMPFWLHAHYRAETKGE